MERERHILSIDLKSFFASVECVVRKLDPFTTPLVVANKKQGDGAITLAVTPYLKKQGVPSRGRIYEIPKDVKYFIVNPRMGLYIEFSKKVVSIYLDYVEKSDLHVYSIDECFLDVTHYLKLYEKTDYELAEEILKEIKVRTGLTATCGIGPNILLAKIAMDVEAKKEVSGIAKWTYEDVKTKLWGISPLSKMWGIGKRMEKRLNSVGIFKVGDLALYNKFALRDQFGVIGEELWNHANGIDESCISDMANEVTDKSYSNSQVLFKDYNEENIKIVIREMAEIISRRLRLSNKLASAIGFSIGYSKMYGGGFYRNMKLDTPTNDLSLIYTICILLFERYYQTGIPIRKVGIRVGKLSDNDMVQLDLFKNLEIMEKDKKEYGAIDEITKRFGKNSLVKASALLSDSTIIDRNKKIGGHAA